MEPSTPKVTLLSRPKDPDAVAIIAAAARLCRKPDSIQRLVDDPTPRPEQERLVRAVLEAGHWSCLRHAVFVFGVEGVSRSESHQHVRHTAGHSYEQQSQHFICERAGEPLAHVALNWLEKVRRERGEAAAADVQVVYEEAVRNAKTAYDLMVELGMPHHEARQALPNGAETRFVWTANLEAVLNFVSRRACRVNTAEIYQVATQVRDIVKAEVPLLEPYLGPTCYTRGVCYEGARRYQAECKKPWGGATVLWAPDFPRVATFVSPKGWWRTRNFGRAPSILDLAPRPYPIKED